MNQEKQDKVIKDAQYRKGLSIAFFNATNSAIELMKATGSVSKEKFLQWRDWLLEEHADYYAKTISRIGLYNVKESLEKLKTVKNLEELKLAWLSFSQDERQDEQIVKVKNELKQKYETASNRTKKSGMVSTPKR